MSFVGSCTFVLACLHNGQVWTGCRASGGNRGRNRKYRRYSRREPGSGFSNRHWRSWRAGRCDNRWHRRPNRNRRRGRDRRDGWLWRHRRNGRPAAHRRRRGHGWHPRHRWPGADRGNAWRRWRGWHGGHARQRRRSGRRSGFHGVGPRGYSSLDLRRSRRAISDGYVRVRLQPPGRLQDRCGVPQPASLQGHLWCQWLRGWRRLFAG